MTFISVINAAVEELRILSMGSDIDLNNSFRLRLALLLGIARAAGISFSVVSTVRPRAVQQELLERWERGDRVGIGAKPACRSWHMPGHDGTRAADVIFAGDSRGQIQWVMGKIWEMLGGRWGGDFSDPDPAHFDLPGPKRPESIC